MNFYSLRLDINDRREYNIELFESGYNHRLNQPKNFIIDVPSYHFFKILSIESQQKIKSFVINQFDIDVDKCLISTERVDNTITVKIQSPIHSAPPPPVETAPVAEPDPIADVDFEDIESFVDYEEQHAKKHITDPEPEMTTPVMPSSEQDLGVLYKYFHLKSIHNPYGYKLDAHLTSSLTKESFPGNLLLVKIQLIVDGRVYENTIHIVLCHPKEFLGIALDFGSESSQMAVKRYEYQEPFHQQVPDNENLFRNIVAFQKNKGWISQESTYSFYQEEPGTNFYKSLFFLKEQLSGNYNDIDQENFIVDAEDNLKMLVNTNDGLDQLFKDKYYQLPNLKILHKHERVLEEFNFEILKQGYPINLKLRELKQNVYNSILKIMIESFLKKEIIRYNGAARHIRMMLLIPNNYDTKDINKTQTNLNIIFESLSQSDEYKDFLLSWEIMTISESDASFIGYIDKHNLHTKNNADYIIIDAGKGTTDFSIIRTGDKNIYNLEPIYRNGFTGAGNLITYAIFETVIHFIREYTPDQISDIEFIKNKVLTVLSSNDLRKRNDFYNQLEKLKFNFKAAPQYQESIRQSWLAAKDGDIGFSNLTTTGISDIAVLTNILNKIHHIADFYGYIQDTCQFIVDNVVNYLKLVKDNKSDSRFAGVILTGRAFKFEPLAEMMTNRLSQELNIPAQNINLLSGNELKDICIKGVFNNSIKVNSEVTGYPIQIVYKSPQHVPENQFTTKKVLPKKSFGKKIFNFFINDLADLEHVEEIVNVKDELEINVLQRSQFLIGCKRYAIRNDEFLQSINDYHYHAEVDFTQRGYIIRKMKGQQLILISALEEIDEGGSGDRSLIVPSLFPNYIDEEFLSSLNTNDILKKSAQKDSNVLDGFYIPKPSNGSKSNNNNNKNNPLFF